jgi:hypothetical protein
VQPRHGEAALGDARHRQRALIRQANQLKPTDEIAQAADAAIDATSTIPATISAWAPHRDGLSLGKFAVRDGAESKPIRRSNRADTGCSNTAL